MSRQRCFREPEILLAVARGWRDRADTAVAVHAATCERCAEVRAAAELLRAAYLRDSGQARIPTSSAMWWRLDRRLRAERARRLQHVAMVVQAIALAAAAGVAVAVVQIVTPWVAESTDPAIHAWQTAANTVRTWAATSSGWLVPIALIVAAWALLVPAALYVGFARE